MDQLLEILKEMHSDVDYANETDWIDNGLLDSLDLQELICNVEDVFGIEFTEDMLVPESFDSLEVLWNVIEEAKR